MGSKKYRNRPRPARGEDEASLRRLGEEFAKSERGGGEFIIKKENKLSAAIVDIAQPLLAGAQTVEDQKAILHMAAIAWTAALLPEAEGAKVVRELVQKTYGVEPEIVDEMLAAMEAMIARKKKLYPEDLRVPRKYEVVIVGDKLQLNVVSDELESY